MSKKDFNKTKEVFLKEIKTKNYSRRQRAQLLKVARQVLLKRQNID